MPYTAVHRFLIGFFLVSGAVLLSTFGLSLWQQPLQGDLTRIGFYSERDYRWLEPQIPQTITATGAHVSNPDIWVLGDSFSVGNQWQSYLTYKNNLQSQTFHYDQIGCIVSWADLAAKHPTVKTVIVEVVQIGFLIRFNSLQECQKTQPKPIETTAHASDITPIQKSFETKTDWRLKHSLLTQLNTIHVNLYRTGSRMGEQVANSPLKPHCANFSNRRNDRLLYQRDSLNHQEKTAESYAQVAANLRYLQTKVESQGKQFLLVVIPDKFSAYRSCIADPEISDGNEAVSTCDLLAAKGIACVNLMPQLIAQRLTTTDIYLPNDTHFSHAGYRLLANAISPYLRQSQTR